MAKDLEMGYLLDFYGDALTEKQREMLRQYYNDDLSLSEIKTLADVVESTQKDELIRAHHIVEEHLKAIDQKIQDLYNLRDQLNRLHSRCHGEDHDHGRCGLIEELTKE